MVARTAPFRTQALKGVCFVSFDAGRRPADGRGDHRSTAKPSKPACAPRRRSAFLFHLSVAERSLPPFAARSRLGVELRCRRRERRKASTARNPYAARDRGGLLHRVSRTHIAVRVVYSLYRRDRAYHPRHLNHSAAIVTRTRGERAAFSSSAFDSATGLLGTRSTRFTERLEFGYGAEIASAPIGCTRAWADGLRELCSAKFVIEVPARFGTPGLISACRFRSARRRTRCTCPRLARSSPRTETPMGHQGGSLIGSIATSHVID